MILLEGKNVVETINSRVEQLKERLTIKPKLSVLGIKGNDASSVYIGRIQKNCEKHNIDFELLLAETEEEFITNFNKVKEDESVTGIMFQEPLPNNLRALINEVPANKDIEGLNYANAGKLMLDMEDANIPCTSKAVIEVLDHYGIDVSGKKVVVMGRSNIVGKPLVLQLLRKNATVTVCHSKTENKDEELRNADIVVMAIGKANYLKAESIKEGAIVIDVGINFIDGKMVGDADFESIKDKASMITPVPGGIGPITNILLIENIIKNCIKED